MRVKRAKRRSLLPVHLLFPALAFACFAVCAAPAEAQDDYPLPAGPPETWGEGRTERLEAEKAGPVSPFSALPPRGNLAQEKPQVPSGEAFEVYTGTRTQVDPDTSAGMPYNPSASAAPPAFPNWRR